MIAAGFQYDRFYRMKECFQNGIELTGMHYCCLIRLKRRLSLDEEAK